MVFLKWLVLVLCIVAAVSGQEAWAVFLFALWFIAGIVTDHEKKQFRGQHPEYY